MDKLRVGVLGAGFFASIAHIPQLLAQVADHLGVDRRDTDYRRMLDAAALDLRPSVVIRFDTGALATITKVVDAFPQERSWRTLGTTLYVGSKGSFSIDSRTDQLLFHTWARGIEEVPKDTLPAPTSPAQNFVGVLRGREEPLLPVSTAVEAVRVVEAAYRSARESRPVHLAPG